MNRRAAAFALAAIFASTGTTARVAVAAEAEAGSTFSAAPIPLELVVNGAHGAVSLVLSRPGDVLVPASDLAQAHVALPATMPAVTIDGVSYVSLQALAPAIVYVVDDEALTLSITVPPSDLPGTNVDLSPAAAPAANAVTSGFLNYDLGSTVASATPGSSYAYEDFGAGGRDGVFRSTLSESTTGITRGLTSFVNEDQVQLHRTTFGDTVADGGALGSDTVLGGIAISRAYDLQPRFVQFPSAGISGTVLAPSTADIYVNGAFVKSVQLQPGAFNLNDLQLQTGANATTVVLRGADGETTTLDSTTYVGASLLRKGLTDYEYDVGFARPDPFGTIDRYGPLSAIARYRAGVSNNVTLGGRVEAQAGLVSAGPRIDVGLPIGTLALYDAYSDDRGITGSAQAFAYTYGGRAFDVDLSATRFSPSYADVQTSPSQDRRLSELDARAYANVARNVSLELADSNVVDRDFGRSQIASADLRFQLGSRATLDLTADRESGEQASWTIGTSLMMRVGERADFTASSQSIGADRTTGVLFDEPAPPGPGFGYRLEAESSPGGDLGYAYASDHTTVGDADVSVTQGFGASAASFGLHGSLAIFGAGIFPTRPLYGSYALADVTGLPHAPVQLNGVDEGMTNGRGMLVIGGLSPYVPNDVSLGDLGAFPDVSDTRSTSTVVPKNFTGVVAPLAVHRVRIFIGTIAIVRAGANVVPAYGRLTLGDGSDAQVSDIGSRGNIYFEDLVPGTYRAAIASNEGSCTFDLVVPAATDMVTDLGAVVCSQ